MVSTMDLQPISIVNKAVITKNAREAAYLALLESLRENSFISDTLEDWRQRNSPSNLDFHFAQQIAFGAAQMALALDYLAEQLSDKKKLSLKLKERALLRLALYQFYFLDKIPLYAIVDESIKLAHKYCHKTFSGYLNAILRKVDKVQNLLPEGNLSIRYSYPQFFVEELLSEYGLDATKAILKAGNSPSQTMARDRSSVSLKMEIIKNPNVIASSSQYYIQNVTPATLIHSLSESLSPPKQVLDLCASPGGKLLSIHDIYPNAKLFANDVSEQKLKRLEENCVKYDLSVDISCGLGENYKSETLFDLIILDVPCSNSGVLNKRPEARWRLTPESIDQLHETQMKLLTNAVSLISPNGEIWYLTCSILKSENEMIIQKACEQLGLKMRFQKTFLPNQEGWDGGFGTALRR